MKRVVRGPILKLVLALGLVVPLVGAPASPATADHAYTAGTANLVGLITFSKFPCESLGTTTCIGLFKGAWKGGLTGISGSTEYSAHWRTDQTVGLTGGQLGTTTPMHSVFYSYDPICTPTFDASGLFEGYAINGTGSAVAAGDEVTEGMATYADGTSRAITRVTMDFDFTFFRTNNGLTVTFTDVDVTAHPVNASPIPMIDSPQVGTGSFFPTHPGYQGGLPGCDAPLTKMEARTDILMTVNHPSDFAP